MTFQNIIYNIDFINRFLFIARGYAGSRQITPEPTASLLMTFLIQYKQQELRSKTRDLLVMRSPLPLLERIVANNYIRGIYDQIIRFERKRVIDRIPERLGVDRVYQSINEGFSNFIFRGYEYEVVSDYIVGVVSNVNAMNYSICLGYHIWYGLIPSIMLSLGLFDIKDIINPEVVKNIMDGTRGWSATMHRIATVIWRDYMLNVIIQDPGGTLLSSGASTSGVGTSPEIGTFDPLGIREEEIIVEELRKGYSIHKILLTKLVILCLATCLLSTISYTTVAGTELCEQFYKK